MKVLLTGVTGAIGKSIAKLVAAKQNTRLYLAVRNVKAGQQIATELQQMTGNEDIFVEEVDLSSKLSVQEFCTSFAKKINGSLDVLINNAAIVSDRKQVTKDGMELQFQTNVYAYWQLMTLLRPVLKAGASSSPSKSARIVNVASNYAAFDVRDLGDVNFDKRRYDSNTAYMQSKAMNRLLTGAAHQVFGNAEGIKVFACHPGVVTSKLLNGLGMPSGFDSPDEGAATPSFLALDESLEKQGGGSYWVNCKLKKCPYVDDKKLSQALWEMCEQF